VLDAGSGTGFPLIELAQRLGSSCRVIGIDPWLAALRRAQMKTETLSIGNAHIVNGDAATLPFPDGQFNLIVSNLGINNFAAPDLVVRECRRVATPDAHLALTTNLRGHMQELYDLYAQTLQELDMPQALITLETHVNHRTTLEGLSMLLLGANFVVRDVFQQTYAMRFLDGSALLRHAFIQLGFLDGWRKVVAPSDERRVFLALEQRLNEHAASRGELRLTIPMAYVMAQCVG
jgi:SAM-dependent methyltransferase